MNIPWWHTEFGESERESLLTAFDKKVFTIGATTKKLEAELAKALNVPFVIVTNSGTSALTMALLALGIRPGDEVIVPNITWIATAQAALACGARVVLADTQIDSPVIDVADVKRKITPKTKAIMPVHMNGRMANIDELNRLAQQHDLAIVEDTCKAMFSADKSRYLGTGKNVGCFSMGMISMVPACFGGFVVTHDEALFKKLEVIRWHGVSYDNGEENYAFPGLNFKYSDLLSAMAWSQLQRVPEKKENLIQLYNRYLKGLANLPFIKMVPVDVETGKLPLLIDVQSPIRRTITQHLASKGIQTCDFHKPLHDAPYLGNSGSFPNSNQMANQAFHLPSGPSQTFGAVDRCLEVLHDLNRDQAFLEKFETQKMKKGS